MARPTVPNLTAYSGQLPNVNDPATWTDRSVDFWTWTTGDGYQNEVEIANYGEAAMDYLDTALAGSETLIDSVARAVKLEDDGRGLGVSNFNTITRTGFYDGIGGAVTGSPPFSIAGTNSFHLIHSQDSLSGDGSFVQIAQGLNGRLFTRSKVANGSPIGDWHSIFGQNNILGTVSQSGGVPTGALIESGENANGTFVRFADGTQICYSQIFQGIDLNTSIGSLFRNASAVVWTYPAAFIDGNIAGSATSIGNSATHWGVVRTTSTDSEISVFSPLSYSGRSVKCLAIGRWF